MRCSGAVLLRARRNGAPLLHLQEHSAAHRTSLVHCARARAADQRGLVVRRRDWQAAGEAPTESLTLSRKISSSEVDAEVDARSRSESGAQG